jgi:predicted NBD/HSP70 family sugar kinase
VNEEPEGGDLSRLRQLNARAVIGVLRGEAPLTLTEIAGRTGLSRASTEDVVRELVGPGWLAEAERTTGTVGRPARRFRFRVDAGRVLGVDVGGHKVLAVLADLDGEVQAGARTAVTPGMGRRQRLAAVDRVIGECLERAGVAAEDLWACGVATTGLVDGTGRVMFSDSLPEWTGVDLAAHVGRLVPGRVLVENDSKLAAYAERWRGAARFADDVVYLLAGLRTGSGLIVGGRLLRGFGNAAGEIRTLPEAGWIRAPEHLHAWLAAHGTGAVAGDPGADPGTDPDADPGLGAVFAAARDGDRSAVAAVRRYVRDLGVGVAALVLMLDPQLVVVGGGFSRSADLIVEPLVAELDRWCVRTPQVRVSTLGDEGVVLGAVRLALDHVSEGWLGTRGGPAGPPGGVGDAGEPGRPGSGQPVV